VLPAGRVSNALASNLDLLPTLMRLAGKPLPDGLDIDGRDISPVLLEDAPSPHEEIVLFNNADVAAVRTAQWKYVVRSYYRSLDIPLDRFNYPLLFDLAADPGENYSVARLRPDVAEEMKGRIERARARYGPFAQARPPAPVPASAAAHPD
jgi:arylsulfatase A-like enzyme